MKYKVTIMLKNGVLDPQGKAIAHALHALGHDSVTDVRQGKIIELDVTDGTDQDTIKSMCDSLLANTVIEDYRIEAA